MLAVSGDVIASCQRLSASVGSALACAFTSLVMRLVYGSNCCMRAEFHWLIGTNELGSERGLGCWVMRPRKVALSGTSNTVEVAPMVKLRTADQLPEPAGRTRHE